MWRLSFAPEVSLFGAILSTISYPGLRDIFYPSIFHYVASIFFALLALNAFIDFIRERKRGAGIAALLFLVGGLLCNELVVVYSFFFVAVAAYLESEDDRAALRSVLPRVLRDTAPFLALAATYLVYRFYVIPEVSAPGAYGQSIRLPFVARNALRILGSFFPDAATLGGASALVLLVLLAIARGPRVPKRALSW